MSQYYCFTVLPNIGHAYVTLPASYFDTNVTPLDNIVFFQYFQLREKFSGTQFYRTNGSGEADTWGNLSPPYQ